MIHIPSDSCAGRTGAGNEPARSAGRDGGDAVDLLSPTLLVVFAAWFLGGFVNGIAGIGAAMVTMPIVSCVMDIHLAILSSCIGGTAVGFFVAVMYRRHCIRRVIGIMALGCIPGAAVGTLILKGTPAHWLQLILGSILLLYIGWQCMDKRPHPFRISLPGAFLGGFGSGLFNTAVSFGGPPIAIYTTLSGMDKDMARSTISVFALVMSAITLGVQASAGMYTQEVLSAALFALPGAFAGLFVSIPFARRIREATFRRALFLLIAAAGVILIARAIH